MGEFKALVQGKAQPYTTSVGVAGVDVPLPNLRKIHDIPIFGYFTQGSEKLVSNISWSVMGVAFSAAFGNLSDEDLLKKFKEIDTDGSGKLDKTEIAKALKELRMSDSDIAQ